MPTKKTKSERSEGESNVTTDRARADFPKHTLDQALQIAQALEDKNGGNALTPLDVAIAIERSPQSSEYRSLLSSSLKYGLTSGSYKSSKIALQAGGQAIVQPKSPSDKRLAMRSAALKPELFGRV